MDNLNKLRDDYYRAIIDISANDVKGLEETLPSPLFPNFLPLMEGILEKIKEETSNITKMIDEETNEEVKAEWKEYLDEIRTKFIICQRKYDEYIEDNTKEDNFDSSEYNLIFAKNLNDKVTFQKDIEKNVDKHAFESVIKLLEFLKNGINTNNNNTEKVRKLINNVSLRGEYEVKEFQTRIIFKKMGKNFFYIEMVRTKKDDNSLVDVNEIIARKKVTSRHYESVKKQIDLNNCEDLIEENNKIYEEIIDYLNQNKISMKGKTQ